MQYVIIALLVLVALAAVIVPLVRSPRGAAVGDLDPLPRAREAGEQPGAGTPPGEPSTPGSPRERETRPATPGPRTAPAPTVLPAGPEPPGEADVEELPIAAPPPPGPTRPFGAEAGAGATATLRPPAGGRATSPEEEAVLRYREALRAHTICPACMTANPPGSKHCMECGERLGGEK